MRGAVGWGLTQPGVVISVTGSAAPGLAESLPVNILGAIERGLMGAARATKAWVVTGGTRTGVMELVGNIMSQEVLTRDVVVLGCSTCVRSASIATTIHRHRVATMCSVRHSMPRALNKNMQGNQVLSLS